MADLQENLSGTRVVASSIAQCTAVDLRKAAQHQQTVAERLQRLHDRRKGEASTFTNRSPALHDDAIGNVDKSQTRGWVSRRVFG